MTAPRPRPPRPRRRPLRGSMLRRVNSFADEARLLEEELEDLEDVHALMTAFVAGKLSVDELLDELAPDDDDDEAMDLDTALGGLVEALAAMEAELAAARRRPPGPRSANGGKGGKDRKGPKQRRRR